MPAGDRTGPLGQGPMTGRGLGYCGGYDAPGYARPWDRRGYLPFYGRGWGRGWRHRYYATGTPGWMPPRYQPLTAEREMEILREQSEQLKAELENIEKRIRDLESD
jgi:hypothetical protein